MFSLCRSALQRVIFTPALKTSLSPSFNLVQETLNANFTTSPVTFKEPIPTPRKWPSQNKKVYPPQQPGEPRREAWVCHYRNQIKYSPKKLLALSQFVRGMSVDEAIKQLEFIHKKGAKVMIEVLKEAQEMAVRDHHVEYKSNLWVADSFVGKGQYIKGLRRNARRRITILKYRYCHYFVRLVEGKPPEYIYSPPKTAEDKLKEYMQELRDRRITHGM
uniref:Large ribosomal subunit protein uL22m n=1 Tax=Ornithodoros turicata TaxID=34597 RepID=A0A2R5LGJ1_9ACAR